MGRIILGLAGACLALSPLRAATSRTLELTNGVPTALDTNNPVELEFHKIMEADDAAQAEVDEMIEANQAKGGTSETLSSAEINRRIREKFTSIGKAYEDFLARHPNHVGARVAFGSCLGDIHDEGGAGRIWSPVPFSKPIPAP